MHLPSRDESVNRMTLEVVSKIVRQGSKTLQNLTSHGFSTRNVRKRRIALQSNVFTPRCEYMHLS